MTARPRSTHFLLIALGFRGDPKFTRLAVQAGSPERWYTALGCWLSALTDAREAKDPAAIDLADAPDWVKPLLTKVGLLDKAGAIPAEAFDRYAPAHKYPSDSTDRPHRKVVSTDDPQGLGITPPDSAPLRPATPASVQFSSGQRSDTSNRSPEGGVGGNGTYAPLRPKPAVDERPSDPERTKREVAAMAGWADAVGRQFMPTSHPDRPAVFALAEAAPNADAAYRAARAQFSTEATK